MKLNLMVTCLCGLILSISANGTSDSEQYKKQMQAEQAAYLTQQQRDFDAYKLQIKQKWGYEEPNTASQMVIYSDDLSQKVVVDYAPREIRVSLIQGSEQDKMTMQQVLEKSLKTSVEKLLIQSHQVINDPVSKQMTLAESLGIKPADITRLKKEIGKSDSAHQDPRYKNIKTRKIKVVSIKGRNPAFKLKK